MGIDLYVMPNSGPCASVQLLAKALGVEMNVKQVDLKQQEQLKPDFIQMNPQHTVPTINDDGFILWESRAILVYLLEAYGKDDSLYPKCPKKKAIINQRLYFHMGTLHQRLADIIKPIIRGETKEISEEKRNKLKEAFGWLNGFLSDGYVAGDSLSLADYCVFPSMVTMESIEADLSAYPNIIAWLAKCKDTMVGYEEFLSSETQRQFMMPMLKEAGVSL